MVNLLQLLEQADAQHRAGRLDEAERSYRQILALVPGEPAIRDVLAVVLFSAGRTGEAIAEVQAAIAAKPDQPQFHGHLGVMLRSLGKLAEAIGEFQRAVALDPSLLEARYNLGNAYQQSGDFESAAEAYRVALRGAPNDPDIHLNLGVALKELGQRAEATKCFEQVLALNPRSADAWVNLGIIAKSDRKFEDAVLCYQRALEINPQSIQAYNNWGAALQAQSQSAAAISNYEKALAINPTYTAALNNLADTYHARGDTQGAIAYFDRSLAVAANDAIRLKRALVLPIIPQSVEEIEASRARLVTRLAELAHEPLSIRDPADSIGAPAFYLAYQGHNDRDTQAEIARLVRRATPTLEFTAPHCHEKSTSARRRIKVGFVSQHFHAHTIGKLNAGIIRQLNREQFEVIVFRLPGHDDGMSRFIAESADTCLMLTPALAAARAEISKQQLDVLIYTDIGMEPLTYYLAHARLAPLQCVTWGHPLTTGIPTVDYFLSSRELEPEGADAHYTERMVRLPSLMNYYYRPTPARGDKSRADFGVAAQAHVYLCPQSLFKLHPDNDRVFAEILKRDPRAQIVMIAARDPHWTEMLQQRQRAAMGALADRIQFVGALPLPDFRRLLAVADVNLDPLHFGGGDTSYEAFAIGSPIVTMAGAFLRSRITYAMYRAMGVTDCIAASLDDYVEIAVRLGTDPPWRRQVHAKIVAASSVLYENAAAVRELEQFLLEASPR